MAADVLNPPATAEMWRRGILPAIRNEQRCLGYSRFLSSFHFLAQHLQIEFAHVRTVNKCRENDKRFCRTLRSIFVNCKSTKWRGGILWKTQGLESQKKFSKFIQLLKKPVRRGEFGWISAWHRTTEMVRLAQNSTRSRLPESYTFGNSSPVVQTHFVAMTTKSLAKMATERHRESGNKE